MPPASAPTSGSSPSRLGKSAADYARLARQVLTPAQADDLWTWCCKHLRTYHGTRWDPERASLMRFWYRVAGARLTGRPDPGISNAHLAEQIWLTLCSQIAKSTWLYALLLFSIRNAPRRAGFFQARIKDLNAARKTRVERMLLQMPQLERLLPRGEEARERALGQAVWTVGTSLTFWLSGSVADDCRMHDLPLMLLDEVDTYPENVEEQGDPIELLIVRQRTFARTRLLAGASSPGTVSGHAWRRTCTGSHHRPLVLCPSCGGADWPNWRQVSLAGGRALDQVHPDEIISQRLGRWACRHCGELHPTAALRAAVADCARADRWCPGTWAIDADHPTGHWKPHAHLDTAGRLREIPPYQGRVWSGQAGSLCSNDETVDTIAAKLAIAAQGKVTQRVTITNVEHAEPWIHVATTDSQDTATLARDAQDGGYLLGTLPPDCPAQWLVLLFDQQGNTRDQWWFPWKLRAVAPGGHSWLVEAGKAMSVAERQDVEHRRWPIGGQLRTYDLAAIDCANGHFTFDAYLWAAEDPANRCVFRGDPRLADGVPWQEVIDQPKRRRTPRPSGVREFKLNPHHWRTRLWDRIRRRPDEPRWHLPLDVPDFYLRSLTSEEQVVERRRVPGVGWRDQVVWRPRLITSTADKQTFRDDNHWWDLEAASAALSDAYGLTRESSETEPLTAVDYVRNLGAAP